MSISSSKSMLIAGDSHSIILGNNIVGTDPTKISRLPGVEVQHLGPALAYTLPMPSSLNAGAKLKDYIASKPHAYDALMLVFGEIDARAHLVKQAVWQGISLSQVVADLVDNYFSYIDQLVEQFGLPVFLWGPIGTMPDAIDFYNPDYPTVGREHERNHATVLVNRALAARCESHPMVHFISIYDQLIDADLRTKPEYYQDGVHLNRKGMHLAYAEIRRRLFQLGFAEFAQRFPEQVYVSDTAALRDVAQDATIVYQSSTHDGGQFAPSKVTNPKGLPFIFHTDLEDRPKLVIDLGCVQMVKHLEIHNRRDGHFERANALQIGVSTNRYTFEPVFKNVARRTFGQDGKPLFLSFDKPGHFRYLQLELEERNYFHLAEVKVWAMSFLNSY